MPLRNTLQTILADYRAATAEPLEAHVLANFIRHAAADEVEEALGELGAGLLVEGSAGAGNWAAVPWVSVFDPAITTTATRGYYVVYLFHVSEPLVHPSLNQGTTAVREEFGSRTRQVLRDRAELMRKRVSELHPPFRSARSTLALKQGFQEIMPRATHSARLTLWRICPMKRPFAQICNLSCGPIARSLIAVE